MKRLLLTGGMGFIGTHVISYILKNTDWEIVSLDRLDFSGNPNRVREIIDQSIARGRVTSVWWDLKAPLNEQVSKTLGQFDHVIHLAASSHVDRSISDPLSFVMDNVVGTTNLLVWAKNGGLRKDGKFLNFSTDESFGPAPVGYAHKESDPHRPSNPYAASKAGQEDIGYAFHVTYGLPVITTHTMNNFGEAQHPEKLVPRTIRSVIEGTDMPIFAELQDNGDLKAVGSRYWLHCTNTASAILFLLDKGTAGEAYNIIGFDELTNLEMAQKIADIIGKPLLYKLVDVYKVRNGHDPRYALDGSKMKELGWVPEVSFEESLKKTVEWTLANPEWQ